MAASVDLVMRGRVEGERGREREGGGRGEGGRGRERERGREGGGEDDVCDLVVGVLSHGSSGVNSVGSTTN